MNDTNKRNRYQYLHLWSEDDEDKGRLFERKGKVSLSLLDDGCRSVQYLHTKSILN